MFGIRKATNNEFCYVRLEDSAIDSFGYPSFGSG